MFREFYPSDKSNLKNLFRAEFLMRQYNRAPVWFIGTRNLLLKQLFGHIGGEIYQIQSPFYCMNGKNISVLK